MIVELDRRGYDSLHAVENPLTSLADDARRTRQMVGQVEGPVVLVGHSYGGAVITEAGDMPNVAALVFVAAFAPDAGETLGAITGQMPPAAADAIAPDSDGYAWIAQDRFRESFCQDLGAEEALAMAVTQKAPVASTFGDPITAPAWRSKPSWYQVSTEDRMIHPDNERRMAERMDARQTVEPAAEGALVFAGSRSVGSLAEIDGVTPVAGDLADAAGPAALVGRALEEHGRVDVLVNNVGAVKQRLEGFLGTDDEEFEWALRMNFFIALRATRAALPSMVERGSGAIVNVASVNAFFEPDAGVLDYGAAKAALVNLAKSLSQEFGPKGIRVNSVSPGPVATDLWLGEGGVADTVAKATGTDFDTARDNVVAAIGGFATGRFTQPEEVANVVAFLASERAVNVTGANYLIDGGLIKTT